MLIKAIQDNLGLAKKALLNGEPIIYPTDTLYSFGALANNSNTINKINSMKNRISPLSIIVENKSKIKKYSYLNKQSQNTINDILPGKYTVLLKAKNHELSQLIQNDSELIGIRIPKHEFCIKLVSSLSFPIITTSVNTHGEKPLTNVADIENIYPDIKIFYDKRTLNSKGSTILDLSENSIKVIRKGDAKIIK